MRQSILLIMMLLMLAFALPTEARRSSGGSGTVRVIGYTKRDGTYVATHRRTGADSTHSNNWSTRGNINPYTGKKGCKSP